MAVVSMSYLLEAGVHFGHQTKRWNPKMKEYIFTARDDIYIIDLQKSAKMIEEAYVVMKEIAQNGGKVLFVGTRKQAQDAIKEESERVKMPYVTERWLGGTLTNFKTIRKRVKRLEEIETMEKDGTFDVLPKKEVIGIKKEYDKLNKVLAGIRDMQRLPEAMFIVDPSKEAIAIAEARRLNIPVFGIVDTNCDPDMVDYVIPGNDDAIRAVKLIVGVMANAIAEATGGTVIDFVTEADKNSHDSKEIMEKALETVKRKEEPRRDDRPRFDNRNNNYRSNDRRDFNKPFQKTEVVAVKEEAKVEVKEVVKETPQEVVKEVVKEVPKEVVKEVKKETPKETVKKVVKAKTVKETVEKVVKTKAVKEDLSTKTVAELRELAKAKDIKGHSTLKKAELIEALK